MSVAPDRPKGPPLNAMRAFEAAARLESFVAAADELGVTPGAVSQHIKTIEAWVDGPLFQRNAKGVELTDLARAILPDFIAAFDALGAATQALRNRRPGLELHVAALPSIAQLWLPPRLGRLRREMPELKISVTAMETPPNLARELFDLSIFFEPADGAGQTVVEADVIFPVCAPEVAEGLSSPDQLNDLPLLYDQTWSDDWALWSKAAGVVLKTGHAAHYSLYSLAVEEAKSGAGVLMGHASLVAEALQKGQLVRPFEQDCETGRSLVLRLADNRLAAREHDRIVSLLAG